MENQVEMKLNFRQALTMDESGDELGFEMLLTYKGVLAEHLQ
jgi:hypothetical protein